MYHTLIKPLFRQTTLAVALGLFLATPSAFAADRTGTVDYGKILQKLPETKAAETTLQETAVAIQKEIAAKSQELQKNIADYRKQQPSLKQALKIKKEQELSQQTQALQKFQQEQGAVFEKKQLEVTRPIRQKIVAAIEAIAQKEGFTVVVDRNTAFYVAPENDLTFKVMDKLNIK